MNLEPQVTVNNETKTDVPRKVWVKPVVEEIEFKDTSGTPGPGNDGSFVNSQ